MNIAPIAWPLIGIAGAIGAICRFTLDSAVERCSSSRFPLGTLSVNLSGATSLGFLHGLGVSSTLALVVGTAGIGTYTTFSTLIFETERLLEDNDRLLAATNILGSMILGLNAAIIGWWIGTSI
jgi:fluoride exporter